MRVLLVAGVGRQRVERRQLPEAPGQRLEPEALVELLPLLDDPFGRFVRQRRVEVEPLDPDQRGPVLGPAVREPVGRQHVGHRLAVALGQLVAGPGVQLAVERSQLLDQLVSQRQHLVGCHVVLRDLVGEEVGIAQGADRLVAQPSQLDQPRLQRRPHFFRRPPDRQPLVRVVAPPQPGVDLVGRDRLAVQRVLEPVQFLDLLGLRRDPRLYQLGHHARLVGRGVEHRLQLPDLQRGQPVALVEEAADPLDVLDTTDERGQRLVGAPGAGGVGRVALDDVRVRLPLRLLRLVVQLLHAVGVTRQVVFDFVRQIGAQRIARQGQAGGQQDGGRDSYVHSSLVRLSRQ